jgi:DNA-directed RNA polymerase subunit K/omega
VWSGYEVLDPARNGAKRVEIASREIARSVDVLEIIEKKEIHLTHCSLVLP